MVTTKSKNGDIYGLHYKNPNSNTIKKIMLTVDLSLDAIHYAIKNNYSFIISRYGLIPNPINHFSPTLVNKLNLLSLHPVNIFVLGEPYAPLLCDSIIEDLYLDNTDAFTINTELRKKMPIGRIASPRFYPNQKKESFQFKHLLKRVKNSVGSILQYAGKLENKIERIAVIGIERVVSIDVLVRLKKLSVDCLISGTLGEYESIFAKELNLSVISLSFYECIKRALEKLQTVLSLQFQREEFYLYDSKNPFNVSNFEDNILINPELKLKKNSK